MDLPLLCLNSDVGELLLNDNDLPLKWCNARWNRLELLFESKLLVFNPVSIKLSVPCVVTAAGSFSAEFSVLLLLICETLLVGGLIYIYIYI